MAHFRVQINGLFCDGYPTFSQQNNKKKEGGGGEGEDGGLEGLITMTITMTNMTAKTTS